MRGKLVVGNWKMNGGLRQNDALLAELRVGWAVPPMRELAVCVPYPYLWQAQAALSDSAIAWGAQNVSEHAGGAYTGEVSAAMVAEFGCRYAIMGHSERRALYGESDIVVAAKATAALAAGLTPLRPGLANGSGQSSSPTSRCGRSAPAERRAPLRRRRSTDCCASVWRGSTTRL